MEKGDRDWLVRSLQRKDITDPEVLDAIANTPRDIFISEPSLKPQAYLDSALPIECGQTISQPFVVAYMTERLHLMPHHQRFGNRHRLRLSDGGAREAGGSYLHN